MHSAIRPRPQALPIALTILVVLVAFGVCDAVMAQGSPFGGSAPRAPQQSGLVGWLLAKQAEFYRGFSGAIRAAKTDGSALYALFGISFMYGIFHAAGPGHGKAVISSYLVANEETWRRGVILSFASALLQALVAVAVVGIAAALLGATARAMGDAVRMIEIVSYALIALLGARLLWVKGREFLSAWYGGEAAHAHGHHGHDHAHGHGHHHHAHDHDHDDHVDHSHGPEPAELAGPGGWKRGLSAIVAVGLRPCSGAILVLVFSLAQGLFWAGVASTFIMGLGTAITVAAIATLAVGAKGLARRLAASRMGKADLLVRGVEVLAAALVLCFGLALLAGYMATERMTL